VLRAEPHTYDMLDNTTAIGKKSPTRNKDVTKPAGTARSHQKKLRAILDRKSHPVIKEPWTSGITTRYTRLMLFAKTFEGPN